MVSIIKNFKDEEGTVGRVFDMHAANPGLSSDTTWSPLRPYRRGPCVQIQEKPWAPLSMFPHSYHHANISKNSESKMAPNMYKFLNNSVSNFTKKSFLWN